MRRVLWAMGALVAACSVQAREADPARAIALLTPVVYETSAGVDPALKQDCDIPAAVQEDMEAAMVHQLVGGKETSTVDGGKTLKVTVADVRGSNGGGWSGVKVLSLNVALFENGQELAHTNFKSETMSPNPFKGACSTMRRVTEKLSRVIVKWARAPKSAMTPTPLAEDATPEADAASAAKE